MPPLRRVDLVCLGLLGLGLCRPAPPATERTVWVPPERAGTWHAGDLCEGGVTRVIYPVEVAGGVGLWVTVGCPTP